jgi:uncharacterized membrane protein YhaH (DUF805 family)
MASLGIILGISSLFVTLFSPFSSLFSFPILIAVFWFGICFSARRLHDLEMTGWWQLVFLVPIVGYFFMLYVNVMPGKDYDNEYGQISVYSKFDIIMCCIFGVIILISSVFHLLNM